MKKKTPKANRKVVKFTARRREAMEAKFIDPHRAIRRWLGRILRSA